MGDERKPGLHAIVPHREVIDAPPADPDRNGKLYRVGGHWFSHEDVWLTAVESATSKRLWTTRFERHARVIAERNGLLLALGLAGDELRLFDIDVETGAKQERARLGFGAYELLSCVHVHRGLAYVPGPGRIVAIDLEDGAVAWEKRVTADKVLPLVSAGNEIYAAYGWRGLQGHETVLAQIDPRDGRAETVTRMSADCHGLLGNDHAVFAKVESSSGNIPFGSHAYAGFARGGAGEPLFVPGEGRGAAAGRFFLMVHEGSVQLVTATEQGLVLSGAKLPIAARHDLRISGSRAYVPSSAVGRRWLEIDLEALSQFPAMARPTASRPLLEARYARPDVPNENVGRASSGTRIVVARPASGSPEPPARAMHSVAIDDVIATLPASFARFRAEVVQSPDVYNHLVWLGMTFLEPPGRWSARRGRDASLVDFARLENGDYLAFYAYPDREGEMPVVRLPADGTRLTYVAEDFSAFLARWLAERELSRSVIVPALRELFAVPLEHPPPPDPPEWFSAAHENRAACWEDAVDETDPSQDRVRERLLVALSLELRGPRLANIKSKLVNVYARLGWESQRRAVLETWDVETR